jgi:hypothetical protein
MTLASLARRADKLAVKAMKRTRGPPPLIAEVQQDPAVVMARTGMTPDCWQMALLRSRFDRGMLLCSRQSGKSTVAAGLALAEAMCRPRSLVLLLSPSERQSGELAAKVFDFYDRLGQPVEARKRTELQLHLVNGSRIIALPENEKTIRGYSGARLLIVDEAARVRDPLYYSVRPMLAVSKGRMLAMSTPFGRQGWFYTEWVSERAWHRTRITADQCPRISREFLAEERASLGERWYRQEYDCSFEDIIGAVFSAEEIAAAFDTDVKPLTI